MCGTGDEYRLQTQNIDKSVPAPDIYPVRIFVNISYSFSNCSSGVNNGCDSFIELRRLVQQMHGSHVSGYGVLPDNRIQNGATSGTQQFYFDMNVTQQHTGVSLFARYLRVCFTVSRVLVYRYECPDQWMGLAHLPATQAPTSGAVSVVPQCPENSHPINNVTCTALGEWTGDYYNYCECDYGYFKFQDTCIIFTAEIETYSVIETEKKKKVCFKASHIVSQDTHVPDATAAFRIVTRDGTAIGMFCMCYSAGIVIHNYMCFIIGNYDYIHVNKTVLFTSQRMQCVDIKIVNDELPEGERCFTVELISQSAVLSSVNIIIYSTREYCQVRYAIIDMLLISLL